MKLLKKQALVAACGVLAVAASLAAAGSQAADAPAWVKESNQDAMILLKVQAQFAPEFAGRTGVDGLDDKIFDLKKGAYERRQQATAEAVKQLEAKQKTATDPT